MSGIGAIYLDHQATTPCDQRVLDAMLPWFAEEFGNPHSEEHGFGRRAAAAVEAARAEIAALIGAEPREIIFVSGATEANNLAIKGAARFVARYGTERMLEGTRRRIITFASEHKCVLESVRALGREGFEPVVLGVTRCGLHDHQALGRALETPALLVSAMAANNETGVLHDLPAIAQACAAAGTMLHSDLAQAAGKIPLDVHKAGLALASISAHKLHGPKGIGALFVRHRPRTRLEPLFSGGGQERGLRSGTLPVALIVGFGEACRLARLGLAEEARRLAALREILWTRLQGEIPGIALTAQGAPHLPAALAVMLPAGRALALIAACPDVAVSTGSACTSAEVAPSHVLTAMGLEADLAARCLRLCPGRTSSPEEMVRAAALLGSAWRGLAA